MTTIRPTPMTGFITCIISSSCFSGMRLAKAVEKAMPMSMKFRAGTGSTTWLRNIPSPADRSSMAPITATEAFWPRTSRSSFPVTKPVIAPRSTGRSTMSSMTPTEICPADRFADTSATTTKNTAAPTRSSRAAMGIRVSVTGPAVFIPLTMDRDGAGAVARAMPPKRNAR